MGTEALGIRIDNVIVLVGKWMVEMLVMMKMMVQFVMGRHFWVMVVVMMGNDFMVGSVMEGRSIMSPRSSVEVQSFWMHQIQGLVGVNYRFVVMMRNQVNVRMGRGVRSQVCNWNRDLVVVMDVLNVMGFCPSWWWLRDRDPLLDLHRSPCLPPVRHVDGLWLPRLDPTRLPGELLCPETIR